MESRKWIVIVEDDLDMHYVYDLIFQELGMADRLKLFDNASDAIQFLHQASNETQLIFSDINMPAINGIELKRKINHDHEIENRQIPFVFMTTATTERDMRNSRDLGIQGFFVKGDTIEEIQTTISSVIMQWTARASA